MASAASAVATYIAKPKTATAVASITTQFRGVSSVASFGQFKPLHIATGARVATYAQFIPPPPGAGGAVATFTGGAGAIYTGAGGAVATFTRGYRVASAVATLSSLRLPESGSALVTISQVRIPYAGSSVATQAQISTASPGTGNFFLLFP